VAKRSILEDEEPQEINLSPMIDCIFILLIFFIVTTVFVEEKGLAVHKPDAAAAATPEETENLVFEISAENEILLDDRKVRIADVTDRVRSLGSGAETPVVIRAHEESDHGVFVAVWDAAKRAGAEKLSFTTIH